MDLLDGSYLVAVSLVGACARALRRGLPEGWRVRLEAKPPQDVGPGWIWLHAVSVGELLLAEGILGRLREAGHRVHVSTGTVAGLELLRSRLPGWDKGTGRISGGAFPLDDPRGLRGFFDPAPGAFVALETELWPNLVRVLAEHRVPRLVVNGRLTPRSLGKGAPWLRRAASRLSLVCARDEASADAFRALRAPRVALGGNLKADLPPPRPLHAGWEPLRTAWSGDAVLVAGNTVEGEEELVLEAWRHARQTHATLRLILAPRHPRRFQEAATLLAAGKVRFLRASEPWPDQEETWREVDVLLLDTLGELPAAYGEGTVAMVGGGWCWHGGHNPLEPVRWGLPTLLGPGYANFEDLVAPLLEAKALNVVAPEGLSAAVLHALDRAPLRPNASGRELPEMLRGALERTWREIQDFLPVTR